jgi:hypothetical protein
MSVLCRCDQQLLEGVIDCALPAEEEYVVKVWDPAQGVCAEFAQCSSPVCSEHTEERYSVRLRSRQGGA